MLRFEDLRVRDQQDLTSDFFNRRFRLIAETIGQLNADVSSVTGDTDRLVALGLNLQYGLMRILNIAHGEFLMVGAYLTWMVQTQWGLSPLWMIPLALCFLSEVVGFRRVAVAAVGFAGVVLYAKPFTAGFDPNAIIGAFGGLFAALVVVAPPMVPGGKFRVLEKIEFHGLDYTAQADRIQKICGIYNVTYIGIDATGIGSAVWQLVRNFFPAAEAISYSPEVKARMVLKTLDVMTKGRLQFDAGWTDMAAAFMSIKKAMTPSGQRVTYQAGRSEETSHADLAWAVMHAVSHEPLDGGTTTTKTSIMEIC